MHGCFPGTGFLRPLFHPGAILASLLGIGIVALLLLPVVHWADPCGRPWLAFVSYNNPARLLIAGRRNSQTRIDDSSLFLESFSFSFFFPALEIRSRFPLSD